MITKFILIVWLGSGQSQTLSIEKFDTKSECDAAAEAVYSVTERYRDWHKCVPYTFEANEE